MNIVVGISGGIAAYKIPELIRLLRKRGDEVKVVTTVNASEFVTPVTLQTLSGYPVYYDVFAAINAHSTEHISLPQWADMMVIAPATANVLAKMAYGIADDALTTTFCAMRKPVVIAPAMNDQMFASPATQEAMARLRIQSNVTLLDCAEGELACGSVGKGRMQEVPVLLEAIRAALTPQTLTGKKVLITAGPTVEKIDPVRYISNFSTGKMGIALANECQRRGAKVTLIMGQMSAQEMYDQALAAWPTADMAILAAAVADFTPAEPAQQKIKKQPGQTTATLSLKTTPDIAAALGASKKEGQLLVGFALETNNEEANAISKLERKNMDWIILNSLQDAGAGFGCDTNKVTLYARTGIKKDIPLLSKEDVAIQILNNIQ